VFASTACADDEGQPFSGDDPAVPPAEADELRDWASRRGYLDWPAETTIHDSAGPHFGGVRVWIDPTLSASLDAGNTQHPVGSTAVKELYGDDDRRDGVSIMLKTKEGTGPEQWYWYERYEGETYADGQADGLCTGCHEAGIDGFRTEFPLR